MEGWVEKVYNICNDPEPGESQVPWRTDTVQLAGVWGLGVGFGY